MTVNTSQYEFAHGHKPRGQGFWAFEMTFTDGHGRFSTETVFANGTPAQARKQAWQQLKAECGAVKELVEVTVLP